MKRKHCSDWLAVVPWIQVASTDSSMSHGSCQCLLFYSSGLLLSNTDCRHPAAPKNVTHEGGESARTELQQRHLTAPSLPSLCDVWYFLAEEVHSHSCQVNLVRWLKTHKVHLRSREKFSWNKQNTVASLLIGTILGYLHHTRESKKSWTVCSLSRLKAA